MQYRGIHLYHLGGRTYMQVYTYIFSETDVVMEIVLAVGRCGK